MALTIPYQPIRVQQTGPNGEADPIIGSYPMAGGQTCIEGDILTIAAGALSKAASNPAAVAGMAMFNSASIYHAFASAGVGLNFGVDQTGTALMPNEGQQMHIIQFDDVVQLEISLSQASTLALSLVGTPVGLTLDGTSGFFFADPAAGNKVAFIARVSGGPDTPNAGAFSRLGLSNGQLGDLGGRVVIQFLAAGLQL